MGVPLDIVALLPYKVWEEGMCKCLEGVVCFLGTHSGRAGVRFIVMLSPQA